MRDNNARNIQIVPASLLQRLSSRRQFEEIVDYKALMGYHLADFRRPSP
jgi:hypothetical protein